MCIARHTSNQALLARSNISTWLLNSISILLSSLDLLWGVRSEVIGRLGQACEYTLKASMRFGSVLVFLMYMCCCMRFFKGPNFLRQYKHFEAAQAITYG